MTNPIEYDVNYDALDAFKREAMQAARTTAAALLKFGFSEIPESRGESAYLLEDDRMILAFVIEGLGTFNKIAEEVYRLTGKTHFANVMRANYATIHNDLATCGAHPLVAGNLISVGHEVWLRDPNVLHDVIDGWLGGCVETGSAWGGGETQKLRDVVGQSSAVLAGAAVGIIKPKFRRIRGNVAEGDLIYIGKSSGIHANGATLVRDVADSLYHGYLTELPNGQSFGEALLAAQHKLYGPLIQAALDEGVDIHYVSPLTGHGWRKVMRLDQPFTYVIEKLPKPQPVFDFIQEKSGSTIRKMYETFNMGGGCAFMVNPEHGKRFANVLRLFGDSGEVAGRVEKGPRRVKLLPIDETFESEEYHVR